MVSTTAITQPSRRHDRPIAARAGCASRPNVGRYTGRDLPGGLTVNKFVRCGDLEYLRQRSIGELRYSRELQFLAIPPGRRQHPGGTMTRMGGQR